MPSGNEHRTRGWPLRLLDAHPLPSCVRGFFVFVLLLGVGRIAIGGGSQAAPGAYDRVLVWVFAFQTGYLLGALPVLVRYTCRRLEALSGVLRLEPAEFERARDSLSRPPGWIFWIATIAGPAVAIGLQEFAVDRVTHMLSTGGSPADWWVIAAGSVAWTVVLGSFAIVVASAWFFKQLGDRHVRVDLFGTDALIPFARVGLSFALLLAGLVAAWQSYRLLPERLFGLPDGSLGVPNLTFISAIIGGLYLSAATTALVLPMWGVHRAVRRRKAHFLAEIGKRIGTDDEVLAAGEVDDPAAAREKLDWLALRERVESVREWPIGTPGMLRFLLYLSLPLASWVAAALVERTIDRMMG